MQVYKAFFKVIKKNLFQISIYIIIFLFFAVLLTNANTNPTSANFSESKINVAIINQDSDSKLINGLKSFLGRNANFIEVPNDTQKLQDALFFRQVEYIVKVPNGFTDGLLNGKAVQLEKTILPGSTSGIFIDSIINKYLDTAEMYAQNMNSLSEEQIVNYVNTDLAQKTEVQLNNSITNTSINSKVNLYFNFMSYSLFAILILGVCSVMVVFNNSDLKKRNLSSPLKLGSYNFQMILGNISYAVLAWFIMIIASFIMYQGYMFTAKGLLFLLNSFILTLAALSISYLLGNVLKSNGAMSAAANVFALGTSFISGVFVPQIFLGKNVLTIASFTPAYWYVKSNNLIADLVNYNSENLVPIFSNMLIVIGFAVAVFAVTLVVIKQRRLSY